MSKHMLRIFGLLTVVIFCAAETLAQTPGFVVGGEEILIDAQTRMNLGLNYFLDGNLGVIKSGAEYTFFGANGEYDPSLIGVAKLTGTLDNPATSVIPRIIISGNPGYNYLAGGPVYQIPGTNTMLMIAHAEIWYPGDRGGFYGQLGLAKSTDGGNTWNYLGDIVSPRCTYDEFLAFVPQYPNDAWISCQIGTGALVTRIENNEEYFYAHFEENETPDRSSQHTTYVAVARAKVADVVNAALANQVVPWSKYYNGSWNEPGLGGRSSNVLSNPIGYAYWSETVSYNTYLGKYVMIYTGGLDPSFSDWGQHVCVSSDGITWSDETLILDVYGRAAYATIVGLGENPQFESGQQFYIYCQGTSDSWSTVTLSRRLVSIDGLGAPTLVSPINDAAVKAWSATLNWTVPVGGDALTWYYVYLVAPDQVTYYEYWQQGTQLNTGTLSQVGLYSWWVLPYNEASGVWGTWSVEGRFNLVGGIPAAPSGLTASQATGKVTLRWTDNSVNEVRFDVYRATGTSTTFTKVGQVGANVKTFAQNVTRGKTYKYKVRAVNAAGGVSSFSNTVQIFVP